MVDRLETVALVAAGVILAGALFHMMKDTEFVRYAADGFDL